MPCIRCIHRVVLWPLRPSSVRGVVQRPISNSATLRYSTPAQEVPLSRSESARTTPPASGTPHVASAAPAGTVLKGLNYFKNKSDPIALEDHEYPDWLWTMLDGKKGGDGLGEDEGDLYSKSQKARRAASRRAAKAKLAAQGRVVEEHIPIDKQTIDLPFATSSLPRPHTVSAIGGLGKDGSSTVTIGGEGGVSEVTVEQALLARKELRTQKRKGNRAGIKERNFLGGL